MTLKQKLRKAKRILSSKFASPNIDVTKTKMQGNRGIRVEKSSSRWFEFRVEGLDWHHVKQSIKRAIESFR